MSTTTEQREMSTIDKLVSTDEQTNEDGSVNVTVTGWAEDDNGRFIDVYFETPTGEEKREKMQFPQPGGDLSEYKFYRLVRNAGLSMRNAELLEGEVVRASVDGSDWSLVAEQETGVTETVSDAARAAAIVVASVPWTRLAIMAIWVTALFTVLATALIILV